MSYTNINKRANFYKRVLNASSLSLLIKQLETSGKKEHQVLVKALKAGGERTLIGGLK